MNFNNLNEQKMSIESFEFNAFSIPQATEKINKSKNWIEWGLDNLYPQYLISLANKSSLHSAILKQKSMLIGGGGWSKTNMSPEALYFLKNVYNEDDLDELLFKIAMDLELYGGFFLNVIWSKNKQTISEINYIDPSKVRIEAPKPGDKYPQTENYYISDGWEKVSTYPPVLYPGFSTVNKTKRSQILYVKEHRYGNEWYARPEYGEAGMRWIEMEYKIADFHLNNINNGFHPSMHINFPIGQPSAEEGAMIITKVKNQYQGSGQAGNAVITFSEDSDSAVTFNPIELNTSDSRFLMLNEQVEDGILKAHRVTNPALFGIETAGALGSRNEMLESLEIFQTQYTEPKQRLIEKIFNWFGKINGINDKFLINKYSPQFSKINTTMMDVLQILESNVTPEQKYHLLVQNDYDAKTAANLTNYHIGKNLKHIDKKEPVPTTPEQPVATQEPTQNITTPNDFQ